MEINAITVCVNYAHLFKHCLGNKRFFKRWIIVTAEDDLDTINLCKENNLETLILPKVKISLDLGLII